MSYAHCISKMAVGELAEGASYSSRRKATLIVFGSGYIGAATLSKSRFIVSGDYYGETDLKKFRSLVEKWKEEIGPDSSLTRITGNMNYMSIISMGEKVVPMILRELQHEPAPWFVALEAITRQNPAKDVPPGKFRAMAEAWMLWGKKHGHI